MTASTRTGGEVEAILVGLAEEGLLPWDSTRLASGAAPSRNKSGRCREMGSGSARRLFSCFERSVGVAEERVAGF